MAVYGYIKSKNMVGYFKNYGIISKLALGMGYEIQDVIIDFKRLDYNLNIIMSEECNRLLGELQKGDIIFVAELCQLCNCGYEFADTIAHVAEVGARIISPVFDSDNYKTEEKIKELTAVALLGGKDNKLADKELALLTINELRSFIDFTLSTKGRYDLSEFASEIKSVEYPEKMFEIANEYLGGASFSELIHRYDLKGMCIPTLKRLCEEFVSVEFLGLVPGSAEFKQAMREALSE